MSKYVKNTTASEIIVRGVTLPPSELVAVPANAELSWAMDENVASLIIAGTIQVMSNATTAITGYFNQVSFLMDALRTSTGIDKVAVYEPEGTGATIVTHNFADKCSWYLFSIQMTNAGMSTLDNITYSDISGKTHFIDLEHGRIYDEDNIMLSSANKYKVRVYVDSVEVFTGFTVNYESGQIIFDAIQTGAVTATYCYADKSYYSVRPKTGKMLSIKAAEVQFSQGTTIPDGGAFIFEPWFIGHPVYGTMAIPGQRTTYKNAKDFISACNQGQGLIPKWNELNYDIHVFPFNYARPKPVKFTDYVEIRVYCKNHTPVGGEYATATFYVTIEDL